MNSFNWSFLSHGILKLEVEAKFLQVVWIYQSLCKASFPKHQPLGKQETASLERYFKGKNHWKQACLHEEPLKNMHCWWKFDQNYHCVFDFSIGKCLMHLFIQYVVHVVNFISSCSWRETTGMCSFFPFACLPICWGVAATLTFCLTYNLLRICCPNLRLILL